LQVPPTAVLRTSTRNSWPTVGLVNGVGKLTRRSVSNVRSLAVRKFASGLSGSSWTAVTVPTRFTLATIASGARREFGVAVGVGVVVSVGVGVAVAVLVGVAVGVGVAVTVGVGVAVAVGVSVGVAVGVAVAVSVGVGV